LVLESSWLLLVLLLPITSMPLVASLTGSSGVAVPSGLILLFMVLAWFIPNMIRGKLLPRQSLPLLGFAFVAVLACALAFFISLPPFKDTSPIRNELKELLTLGVGVCFYLLAATWPSDEKRLAITLRWLNWSGLLVLLWSAVQILVWYSNKRYPGWVWDIQAVFSIGTLYRQRPAGFTMEPSWLANQLNMLYLPLWLAATVKRFSAHRFHFRQLTFENFLLVFGAVIMFLSLSRVGLLAFLLMLAYLLLRASLRLTKWIQDRFSGIKSRLAQKWAARRRMLFAIIFSLLILSYLAVFGGVALALNKLDPRMGKLFQYDATQENALLRYANQLFFASRIVYWQVGWEVFNDHPIMGVGLGNAGYYFPQKMSAYGWGLVEIRKLMVHASELPNIKSLWVRLLAETGLVGFSLFACWLYLHWQSAHFLENSTSDNQIKMIALAGKFTILGLIFEGFSVDSFALPYLWFALGLVAAACESEYRKIVDKKSSSKEDYYENLA
jgi:hypothetical protein